MAKKKNSMQSEGGIWKWSKPPPESRKQAAVDAKGTKKGRHPKQTKTIRERLLKGMVF